MDWLKKIAAMGLGARMDRALAPTLGESPRNLDDVDRMDWELWLLVTLVLLCLLITFILNHAPGLLPPVEQVLKPADLEIYVDGLTVLVLLFCLYVIQKHRQLRETRSNLVKSEIEKEGLYQRFSIIELLYGISEEITSGNETHDIYQNLLEKVRLIMDADLATLYFLDSDSEELVLEGYADTGDTTLPERIQLGEGIAGLVARNMEPLLINHPFEETALEDIADVEKSLKSAVYIPLIVEGEVWGVMGVGVRSSRTAYTSADLKLMHIFGNSMAMFTSKNNLILQLQESLRKNRETQLQLIQTEKLAGLGELMAGISHELNNPLSVILGNTDLLLREDLEEEMHQRLEKMSQEALRAKELVENLLKAARGEETFGEEVDLNEVVEQSLSLLRYQVSLDDVKVETDLADALPPSVLDPFQIQQLIFNLVNNARQAMLSTERDNRVVSVLTELLEEDPVDGHGPVPAVHLQVRDTGSGIPEEYLDRIFDPFFTTKEIGSGTGLGLSICFRIVKELGGRITAGNNTDGGAVIDIWLPVSESSTEEKIGDESEKVSPSVPARPGSVLIVDDEENILDLIGEILAEDGHTVVNARNGREALDVLREIDPPNAIVLDLKMPVMDGQSLFLELKDRRPELADRVLFLTGDTMSREARSFLENVNRPYMSKPFSNNKLREMVAASMEW